MFIKELEQEQKEKLRLHEAAFRSLSKFEGGHPRSGKSGRPRYLTDEEEEEYTRLVDLEVSTKVDLDEINKNFFGETI